MQEAPSIIPSAEPPRPGFEVARNAFQAAIVSEWMTHHPELAVPDQQVALAGFFRGYFGRFAQLYEERQMRLINNPAQHPELVQEWARGIEEDWKRYHTMSVNVTNIQ